MKRTLLILLGLLPALLVAVPRRDVPAPGEAPAVVVAELGLAAGGRVDLAAGTLTAGPRADLEAGRGPGGALLLRPGEGISLSASRRGPVAIDDVSTWSLPPAAVGDASRRHVLLRPGDWATFQSEHAGAGRIELAGPWGQDGWTLRIVVAPGPTDHLPRPPAAPGDVERDGWTVRVPCAPLAKVPAGRAQVHVLEREEPFGAGRWHRIAERSGAGELVGPLAAPGDGAFPVARLRVRRGLDGGPLSEPGPPFSVLTSAEVDGAEIQRAVTALADPGFQRRVEAQGLLELVGERARPALEAARTSADSALAQAARARLSRLDEREDAPSARRARLAALVRGVDGEAPDGLGDSDPADRAAALLRAFDERGAAGARPWAEAVGVDDPHPGVRTFATFLALVAEHEVPASAPARGPVWLVAPGARGESWPVPFAGDPIPGPAERAWEIVERPELADLRIGPALGRVLLALTAGREAGPAGREETSIELALELVRRAAAADQDARAALVGAVEALLPGDEATLAAIRVVGDRRRSPGEGAPARELIELEAADLGLLRDELARLAERFEPGTPARDRWVGADLVLPPGKYGLTNGELTTLDVEVSGLRLLAAAPGVVLKAGLRVRGATDVVLEGITVESSVGQALTVIERGHVVALDSTLLGRARVVHVDDAALELHGSTLAPAANQPTHGSTAQLIGGALLYARGSVLGGGSLFVGQGGADVRLDRCVLDTGDRPLAQGQRGGRLVARETFFLSSGAGFMAMDEIVLAASVVDAAFQPFGRGDSEVRVGPELFALTGSGGGSARIDRARVELLPMAPVPVASPREGAGSR